MIKKMKLEKDLKIIETFAKEKNDENRNFRSFLNQLDYEIEKLKDELWHYDES